MAGLLTLLLYVAIVGFIIWLIVTYIPMPEIMKRVLIVIVAIVVIIWLIGQLGGGTLGLPSLR